MRVTSILRSGAQSICLGVLAALVAGCSGGSGGGGTTVIVAACPATQTQTTPPAPPPGAPSGIALARQQINTGFTLTFPLFLTAPPGDTARLFVVEKGGVIKVVNRVTGTLIGTFLDISNLVSNGSEQGLLGLAFDPQYTVNGRFYVSYTDVNGTSVVARYLVSSNPDVALLSPA